MNTVNAWVDTKGYGNQELVDAASDMELDWNSPGATMNWVNGFNSTAQYNLYDCGDDAGGTNPDNTWTAPDVWYVAYGAKEISQCQRFILWQCNTDWGPLDTWAKSNKGNYMNFMGALLNMPQNKK